MVVPISSLHELVYMYVHRVPKLATPLQIS